MDCVTLKPGVDCIFMSKNGCNFNGGMCHSVVDECEGCSRIVEHSSVRFCSVAPDPASKWVRGLCNFATHIKKEAKIEALNTNPLKASKRAAAMR